MRSIRRFSQLILTLIGGAIVIYAVFRVEGVQNRVLLAALGLLVMELGIWQVTQALFPNEREYKPLRDETDYFLALVRRMNAASVKDGNESEVDQLQSEMHVSIERMRRVAGRTEEELGLTVEVPAKARWWKSRSDPGIAARVSERKV